MITGIVLAGGRSSRMGRDKAFLSVEGKRLIELVVSQLRPSVERVLVVGHAGNASRLIAVCGERVLMDLRPGHGPLMGIYTGLMAADTPLALIVPCDMPWIEGRLIARLIDRCQTGSEVAAACHPMDGVQPFPLACRTSACRTIGRLLNQGERSLQALLQQPGSEVVTVDDPALWTGFMNVNTPDDYANLHDAPPHAP